MSSFLKHSPLRQAVSELSRTLNSSLGHQGECANALAQIEATIGVIEQKLITSDSESNSNFDAANQDVQRDLNFSVGADKDTNEIYSEPIVPQPITSIS